MIPMPIHNHDDTLLPLQNNDKCAQFKGKLKKCNREGVSDELKTMRFYSFVNSFYNMNVINLFKLIGICEVFLLQFVVVMGDDDAVASASFPRGLSNFLIQASAIAKISVATIKKLAEKSVEVIQNDILCKISNRPNVICNREAAIAVLVIFISIVLGIIGYIFSKFFFCVSRSHRRRIRRNRLKKMEEQEQLQAEMLQQQMQHMQMQGEQMRQQLAYQSQMQQALMQQAQMQQEQMRQEQMRQEQMRQEQMRQAQIQGQIQDQNINGYSEASLNYEHSHSEDNFIGLGYQSTP